MVAKRVFKGHLQTFNTSHCFARDTISLSSLEILCYIHFQYKNNNSSLLYSTLLSNMSNTAVHSIHSQQKDAAQGKMAAVGSDEVRFLSSTQHSLFVIFHYGEDRTKLLTI